MGITVFPASVLDYPERVQRGLVSGAELIHKFGRNPDVTSGSWESVWQESTSYSFPTSASTLEAVSSVSTDNASGAGAQQITVEGLDGSFAEISEVITMDATDGTTPSSATSSSFLRVNRAYVSRAGTYGGANDGTITIRISSAGATQASIGLDTSVGLGQSQIARYTIPASKQAIILRVSLTVESTKNADFALYQRQDADDVTTPFTGKRLIEYYDGIDTAFHEDYTPGGLGLFPAKTDLFWEVKANSANTQVTSSFDLLVENA